MEAYSHGMMVPTPHLDRLAREGMLFTDHYAEPSGTPGRAAFITGQMPIRTGLTTVGMPGSQIGFDKRDPSLAEVRKAWIGGVMQDLLTAHAISLRAYPPRQIGASLRPDEDSGAATGTKAPIAP